LAPPFCEWGRFPCLRFGLQLGAVNSAGSPDNVFDAAAEKKVQSLHANPQVILPCSLIEAGMKR
jgi:hypothetical protein